MNVPHVACKKCQSTQMSKWRKSPALSKQVSWRRTILAAPFTSQKTSPWVSYLDSTMFLIPPFSFSSSSHLILASLFLQTAFTSLHGECQMRSIPSKTEFRIPCELASLPLAPHSTCSQPWGQLFRSCLVATCARTHRNSARN